MRHTPALETPALWSRWPRRRRRGWGRVTQHLCLSTHTHTSRDSSRDISNNNSNEITYQRWAEMRAHRQSPASGSEVRQRAARVCSRIIRVVKCFTSHFLHIKYTHTHTLARRTGARLHAFEARVCFRSQQSYNKCARAHFPPCTATSYLL